MWDRWSKHVIRNWWKWIIGWFVITAAIRIPAPQIPTLLKDDAKSFLPADLPSQRALTKLRQEFPDRAPASRAVVVATRETGLTSVDRDFLSRLTEELETQSTTQGWGVTSAAKSWFLKPVLESPDGQCSIVVVDLPAALLTHSTVNRVHVVEALVERAQAPEGLDVQITGSGAMGALLDAGTKRDIDRTTLWAVAAIFVILLFVYRSPVAMLLPLVTIGTALSAAIGVVGWMARFGWPLNGLLQLFIIVMVLGCGVDYCLLLFARFVEELQSEQTSEGPTLVSAKQSSDRRLRALQSALAHSSGAIVAGAGTVAAGLTALALARHRDYQTSGPTIGLSIAIATFCVLSLTPAMMRLAGRWLLPPRIFHVSAPGDARLWQWIGRIVTHHPWRVSISTLVLLGPLAVFAATLKPMHDSLDEFPANSSFVLGARQYYRHFFQSDGATEMILLVATDARLDGTAADSALDHLLLNIHDELKKSLPLASQRDIADPLGSIRQPNSNAAAAEVLAKLGRSQARGAYIGKSEMTTRVDLAFKESTDWRDASDMVEEIRRIVSESISRTGFVAKIGGTHADVYLSGEAPFEADHRTLRIRDITFCAIGSITVVLVILYLLTKSIRQAVILVLATVLTYFAAYGATWAIIRITYGLPGLDSDLSFLLFVIILSLGQDYNIFVAARITEEMRSHPPREAIETAVRRTGRVVSSCGIIMAATFASMGTGSLLLMKEFAIALALGILIDTFIVRPLLVPSLILLTRAWPQGRTAP